MKRTLTAIVIAGLTLTIGVQPSLGQTEQILDTLKNVLNGPNNPLNILKPPAPPVTRTYPDGALGRAMNLARQTAERTNGGLNYYRAEKAMYGPVSDAPYKDNQNGTVTFTFLGGAPALPPTIQSVVTVRVDDTKVDIPVVVINYNGPIRSASNG